MIEFEIGGFCLLLRFLWEEERASDFGLVDALPPEPPSILGGSGSKGLLGDTDYAGKLFGMGFHKFINQQSKEQIGGLLRFFESQAVLLEMERTIDRITRFRTKLDNMSPDEYRTQARTLREAIDDDLKKKFCIYVDRINAERFLSIEHDWPKTLSAFPSGETEIRAAISSLCIGNATACVFHFMRLTELGLRALAQERGIKKIRNKWALAWADWQDIISAIEKKVESLNNKPRGPARQKAIEFYRGVLGEFGAFKDIYRNNVMHMRVTYDEDQARSVQNHVREFMERLSGKVGEGQAKQIAWGRMA